MRTVQVALPEHLQRLVDELVDNQAAQVWLQQEGAFHLGVADRPAPGAAGAARSR